MSLICIAVKSSACKSHKQNYFWCPVKGCMSRSVTKVTQYLHKVYKMDPAAAARQQRPRRWPHWKPSSWAWPIPPPTR